MLVDELGGEDAYPPVVSAIVPTYIRGDPDMPRPGKLLRANTWHGETGNAVLPQGPRNETTRLGGSSGSRFGTPGEYGVMDGKRPMSLAAGFPTPAMQTLMIWIPQ
jgi:hypothetical protein